MLLCNSILHLQERLFWDTEFNKLDIQKHDFAIITRVFDYGSWDDVLEVIAYYGEKKTKRYLKRYSGLKLRALNLACSIFQLKPTDFKCYTKNQSLPSF